MKNQQLSLKLVERIQQQGCLLHCTARGHGSRGQAAGRRKELRE